MFKKPLSDLKTSAPLRSSDRRKFKQRVIREFSLHSDDGELLVPEGLLSQKFSTHLNELGVTYLSVEGDPLWFSIGRNSEVLIPTIYTLWKKRDLLPIISTPAAVISKLTDGADLMIPGVIQHTAGLVPDQLVAITQYRREKYGPPLAIGRMAVSSEVLQRANEADTKGKAVYVLHTWKDSLWDLGPSKKIDVPEPLDPLLPSATPESNEHPEEVRVVNGAVPGVPVSSDPAAFTELSEQLTAQAGAASTEPEGQPKSSTLTPEEISTYLRNALLQAINTTLGSLPSSAYPMQASVFWSNHVLPSRPAHMQGVNGSIDVHAIDIKHSSYKTVKSFLKASAKEGLVKLKETKGDVVVTGVSPKHSAVAGHQSYRTLGSVKAQQDKAEERERKKEEAEEKQKTLISVSELWKPHGSTVGWFVAAEADTSNLYSISDIREVFIMYVEAKGLINANDPQYINISEDEALSAAVWTKNEDTPEFMKRQDVLNQVRANMQEWYEMHTAKSELVRKKGQVKPIQVEAKVRQGRKTSTFITGLEPFGLDATEIAEELRKRCASSTSVSPLPGKGSELEVMVQGIHIKVVTDMLVGKGVPDKWIKVTGLKEKKK